MLVRSYGVWQTRTALWARYADGAVLRLSPARDVGMIGTGIEYWLPARAAAPQRLLWRVEGAGNTRGVVLGARLFTLAEHVQRNAGAGLMVGWFAGLCVGFLFLNMVLWLVLRRQFQLAYCAMVGGMLLYVVADAGLVRHALRDFGISADLKLSSITFTLSIVGGLWFARSFLEADLVGPRLTLANRLLIAAMLIVGMVQMALPPEEMLLIDKPQAITFLLAVTMFGALMWRAWTRHSAFRWIWSATVIVPALLAGMRAANSFPQLGMLFAMRDWMMVMMTVAMFASALAIAYRISLLSRERDQAREQEIVARLLADTDPLTGLLNRRAFLHRAIGRAGDQTLLILDIDHFKRVNETIGHDGGDEVLRVIARALRAAMPAGCLIARIGGEEFAMIADADGAVPPNVVLDRLRAERMPFDVAVTSSIGTCTGPLQREIDWKTLYRQADRALFAAKAAGRDRARDAAQLMAA